MSQMYIVELAMLYGGNFNMFTTCKMVDISTGLIFVNASNVTSNYIFKPFRSRFTWNKGKIKSLW